jgi:hypothetical protein
MRKVVEKCPAQRKKRKGGIDRGQGLIHFLHKTRMKQNNTIKPHSLFFLCADKRLRRQPATQQKKQHFNIPYKKPLK